MRYTWGACARHVVRGGHIPPMADRTSNTLAGLARANGARVYGRVVVPPGAKLPLETVLTHPDLFALTEATNTQRAICRCSDGLPLGELWDDPQVREAFGGVAPEPGKPPKKLYILAAIRGGKSLLSAAKAWQASQEADLSKTRPGDEIRIPILSFDKDAAHAVFRHLRENVLRSPALRATLAADPTTDSIQLRHPSGRAIEVKVTAVARAGSTLVARWLPSLIFDEAPRMASEEDSVESLEESLRAVDGRMLPGGQILLVGSPHAPRGVCYKADQEYWGKPDIDRAVIIRAPGPALNPSHWTPEQCEAVRLSDPIAYEANVLARFVTSGVGMFALAHVERCTRKDTEPLPPDRHCTYVAAIDPATRRNHWTLVVATRSADESGRLRNRLVLTKTYAPPDNTDPDAVFADIAKTLEPYGVKVLRTDQWAVDALRAVAQRYGLGLAEEVITQARKFELFDGLRIQTETDEVEFTNDPRIVSDLMRIRKVVTQTGVKVDTPESSDGGHCDMAAAVALVIAYAIAPPRVDAPAHGTEAHWAEVVAKDKAAALDKAASMARKRWKRGGFRAIGG